MEEIEVKILEIDQPEMIRKMAQIGAMLEFDSRFEALFFDYTNSEIRERGEVLRLRREGEQAVLAYKTPISLDGAKVMRETETSVADFDAMKEILLAAGFIITKHTSKRRIQYQWEDCHLVIDDYEGELAAVPPFLEIEAPSREQLSHALDVLGIAPEIALPWSTYDLVKHYKGE
ncbi:MAG: class IV adenylate cyclase [Bacteroidia bacterium]|nr:class IV adenylate cyclase [Bacteroidia bacterium]